MVLVSGGFDPLHVGHLDYLEAAAELGDVIVALNSDDWLHRKKGYVFMPHADRARILKALSVVKDVTPVNDADGTVSEALIRLRPHYFANGGDRVNSNTPETNWCLENGIAVAFNIGGGKVRSSSDLVKKAGR